MYFLAKWKWVCCTIFCWNNWIQDICQKLRRIIIIVPMEETIVRNINVSAGDFNLCVLGVPYILAVCQPQGYMLSCCFLVKKSLFFKLRKNLWSFPPQCNVGSDDNFKHFDALLTISYSLDIYSHLFTITIPFPLPLLYASLYRLVF